jgi:uncharacterized protein (DUF2147 family)
MKHRIFAPALGLLVAALFTAGASSQAFAADPSGIWAKDDGSAKMEIKKCGRGICSKIVWLREPNDARGKPLHDIRNEDPSMHDRPIIGLPLFGNMNLTDANTWVGDVYNPEEGHIYSDVKVTLVSRQQIVLRGCKAWLLCGEKIWTRSQLAPVPAEPAEPIEVKAPAEPTPGEATPRPDAKLQAPMVEAAREPEAELAPKPGVKATSAVGAAMPTATIEANAAMESVAPPKMLKPPAQPTSIGPGFVMATASPEPLPLSGENVSSMMVMTNPTPAAARTEPLMTEAAAEPADQEAEAADQTQDRPVPLRPAKPKPKTQAAQADAPAAPKAVTPKPKPKRVVEEPQEQLPWLQHP